MKDQFKLELIDLIQSFRDKAKKDRASLLPGYEIGCPDNDVVYASADTYDECADSLEKLLTKHL